MEAKESPAACDGRAKATNQKPTVPSKPFVAQSQPETAAPVTLAAVEAGVRFGNWTVLSVDPSARRTSCLCRCARTRQVTFNALLSGESTSCGCAALEKSEVDARRREATQRNRRIDRDWRPERGR